MTNGAVRRRAAILTYHSLDESGSVISTHPKNFERQMEALASGPARVVPLTEVLEHPAAVAITFDDGFANFADHAVPVLERLSLAATVTRLKSEGVTFLEEIHPWGTSRAAMIEGPDRVAIELVEVK